MSVDIDPDDGPDTVRRYSTPKRSAAFRTYYMELDIFLSLEGILKVVSIMGCIVSSVLFWSGGSCGGAAWLAAGAGVVALAAAAALALLYAAVALRLPLLAPQFTLYTDILVSSVAGVLLLLSGVLSMTVCELSGLVDYVHGPLAMLIATLVVGSAIITHASAMRQYDAAAGAAPPAPRAPPFAEQDA